MANIEILIREKNENWPHDVYWCQKQKFTGAEKHLRIADKYVVQQEWLKIQSGQMALSEFTGVL